MPNEPTIVDADRDMLARLIEAGMPVREACMLSRINWRTHYRYIQLGDSGNEKYVEYAAIMVAAKATWRQTLIKRTASHSIEDATTARWLLSKEMPERYGQEPKPAEDVVNDAYAGLSDAEVTELLADNPQIQQAVLAKLGMTRALPAGEDDE